MIGEIVGHYKIIDKLGEGGMGAVYKAEDTTLNRLIALKTLSQSLSRNEEARERFVREAQAASAINHPNITTVFELLEEDDSHYISMEYVDGKTIRDMVESGHVSIRKAVDIILQAAEALRAAHRKGILHRDIKSANIMVSMEGKVKVMDFGLAHLEERSQLTRTGTTMGTLAYSSPEQLTGNPYDERSEIWSLGVVFYELLTGQLPFRGPSEGELLFAIINKEQDSPNSYREDVPKQFCDVIANMLLKKPELRYQNCGELISDLKVIQSELETSTDRIITRSTLKEGMRTRTITAVVVGVFAALAAIYLLVLSPAPTKLPRVAVLPFVNLGSSDNEILSVGIANELRSRLLSLQGLIPIPRSYIDQFMQTGVYRQEIGRKVGADFVVDGTVQWSIQESGRRQLRLTPELINSTNGELLWSRQYDIEFRDILVTQTEIANMIIDELSIKLTSQEQQAIEAVLTTNQDAYEYYLIADEYITRGSSSENLLISESQLREAIALDPEFADAWALLSYVHSLMYWYDYDGSPQRIDMAKAAIDRAVELNRNSPNVRRCLGRYHYTLLDFEQALIHYEYVLRKQPNNATAHALVGYTYRRQGQMQKAISSLERSLELSPHPDHTLNLAETYSLIRQYSKALELYEIPIHEIPNFERSHWHKAATLILAYGDTKAARETIREGREYFSNEELNLLAYQLVLVELFDGNYSEALKELSLHTNGVFQDQFFYIPTALLSARAYELMGEESLKQIHYQSAIEQLEIELLRRPDDARLYSSLGIAKAGLGLEKEAVLAGQRGVNLLPIEKEAYRGYFREIDLAQILVMVGRYEEAVTLLDRLLSLPGRMSVALLNTDPIWDPIRDNPQFRTLLRKYR